MFPPTLFARGKQDVILHIQNARSAIGPLQQRPDADEIPAFAVRHGGVGDALEKVRASHDALEKLMRTGGQQFPRVVALHEKIEPVDLFPHLAGNLLARRPGIFARQGETGKNRVRIFLLQRQKLDHRALVGRFVERIEKLGLFERSDHRRPVLHGVGLAPEIEEQLQIDIENAGVILRPLDVAAHPVEGIGDAA